MSISALMIQGLQLMLMGMGFVFVFLGLLVVVVTFVSRLLADRAASLSTTKNGIGGQVDPTSDPELVSVITAAIHQHRTQTKNSG